MVETAVNGRVTIGLVLFLILLSSYVYFFEPAETDEAGLLPPIYETPYREYDIVELEVTGVQTQAHFARTAGSFTRDWKMVRPSPRPPDQLDQVRVNGAAVRLGQLTADQVITNVTNLAKYGLAPPALTVTLTISTGQTVTLYAGDETPVADKRYLRAAADDRTVYLVFALAIEELKSLLESPPVKPAP